MYLSDFQSAGQKLYQTGLISGTSGNLSIRINSEIIITRHGSCLSSLDQADLVRTGIEKMMLLLFRLHGNCRYTGLSI